ncbi:uncharacterized protein NPIL_514701 [Nephila pilipes]|uniref:Uncharacterized protein n=1 Tax=Nephila pilipes TaxID=299642 RepID=A0A8X6PRE2_NEPPI|nr:uncharacterized protein NPIL_514701 [Nephila pilipes]
MPTETAVNRKRPYTFCSEKTRTEEVIMSKEDAGITRPHKEKRGRRQCSPLLEKKGKKAKGLSFKVEFRKGKPAYDRWINKGNSEKKNNLKMSFLSRALNEELEEVVTEMLIKTLPFRLRGLNSSNEMFIELLINAFLFSLALGGTVCPPRSDMHPCVCTNVIVSQRKLHTTVNCHHLPNSNAFNVILPSLRKMEINKFILYDSFWEAHRLGDSENKTALPPDWLRLLKIKEFEIYDTALTSNFACHPKMVCKNTFTHRFIAVNSSTSDTFVSMCTRKENDGKVIHTPWIACMNNLKYFQYSHGRLTNLSKEWFPIKMKELLVVNLTQNYIKIINPGDFNNLIKLTALDLSHNLIEYLDFFSITTTLEILDLR